MYLASNYVVDSRSILLDPLPYILPFFIFTTRINFLTQNDCLHLLSLINQFNVGIFVALNLQLLQRFAFIIVPMIIDIYLLYKYGSFFYFETFLFVLILSSHVTCKKAT